MYVYDRYYVHEMFSSTGLTTTSLGVEHHSQGMNTPHTLGKWDLWSRLQPCSAVECAAIAVLSNLYNNDCDVIDTTPYTFVTVRDVVG